MVVLFFHLLPVFTSAHFLCIITVNSTKKIHYVRSTGGKVRAIYSYLLSSIEQDYKTIRTLKSSERGCVSLLQNRQNGKLLQKSVQD